MKNKLMAMVQYVNHSERIFADSASSLLFRIAPGTIRGRFTIEPSGNPEHPFESVYANSCSFVFRSKEGRCFQYSAIVHPLFFWTESTRIPVEDMEHFRPEYEFKCYIDHREEYVVALGKSRSIRGFFKYTPVEFAFEMRQSEVVIRVKIGAVSSESVQGELKREVFFSTISMERFLWISGRQARGLLAVAVTPLADEPAAIAASPIDVSLQAKSE